MRTLTILLSILLTPTFVSSQAPPLHGIDVLDIDRAVDPCADFYGFANGAWRAKNPIPPSMTRWSKRWQAGETSKEKLKDLLEAAEKSPGAAKGSVEQLIGDYYGACMDERKVNARGVEPLKPWFAKIDGAKDIAGLERVMAELHDIGIGVPFGLSGQQDRSVLRRR
jgi:endothelin-converting enzyme/putative endopeptidase